eukprot:5893238-Pyramimonas_sp.AAC.1
MAPCWPRNESEPLTVADWILKFARVLVRAFFYGQDKRLPRALSRRFALPIEEAQRWLGN